MSEKELSRAEVAQRLGCSQTTVLRFEEAGQLHPRRERPEGHCRVWFKAEEVEKLAHEWQRRKFRSKDKIDTTLIERNVRGKIAAKVIPMFEAGERSLAVICAATEADPLIIVQLYETWKLGLDGAVTAKKQRELEEREREERRAYDADKRQERWVNMRLEVAKLEGKKPFALPKLEHPPMNIDTGNGKKRAM